MNAVDYATVFGVGEAFGRRFYKVEFLVSSDAGYILESEVRPVFSHVVGRLGLAGDRLRGLEEVLEKLARFVAELRRARDGAGVAGIVVAAPGGPGLRQGGGDRGYSYADDRCRRGRCRGV